ncbi:protein kinase domain-containing protein [Streptomyces sp. HMX87]|uniref:protein kinase domain-containing protein n=1 Tax=Streptomyces sp. HMX87 TaxID=3390849 RepID=UPI003A868E58
MTNTSMYIGPDSAPDRYRLLRSIGRGGEAVLYLAEIELSGASEPVVIKVFDAEATLTPAELAKVSARWSEQAELLRFVHRLGVVGVREHFEGPPAHRKGAAGTPAGRSLCLVMNYVEGVDLRDWRAEHPLVTPAERREAVRYLEQLAEVLDWLHAGKGTPSGRVVVHGDLSPGNVMVDANGQATLVDFGLSKLTAEHRTAEVWFTPGFAAPEVFEGRRTPATDRYAFGAIACFLLSGESPAHTPEQLRGQFLALPELTALPAERQAELAAVCATDPEQRPDSLVRWVSGLRTAVISTTTAASRRMAGAAPAAAPVDTPPAPATPPAADYVPARPTTAPAQPARPPRTTPTRALTPEAPPTLPPPQPPHGPHTAAAATQPATPSPLPPPPPSKRSRRALTIAATLLAVAVVAGAGTYAAVRMTEDDRTGNTASQDDPPPAAATPGPADTPDAEPSVAPTPSSSPEGAGDGTASPSATGTGAGAGTGKLPLTSLEAVEMKNMEQGSATVDTQDHEDALLADAGFCFVSSAEYNLAREWNTLRFTAGITDVSADGIPRKLTVHGDGKLLTSKTLNFGTAESVSVDVSDVLRLRIEVRNVDSDGCSSDVVTALAGPLLTR